MPGRDVAAFHDPFTVEPPAATMGPLPWKDLPILDRRTLLTAAAAAPIAGVTLGSGSSAAAAPRAVKVLARGLEVPWGMGFLPNGNALVTERMRGDVHVVRRGGGRRRIGSVRGVEPVGEGGLLGLALSPSFHKDRWVYLYLSTGSDNRIIRMRYADGRLRKRQLVLAGIPVNSNHDGGRIAFGPDGLLYAGTGDAGDTGLSQDTGSYAGKILRMTPTGEVPARNPFGNHVWTYGHRNVQGLAWSRDGRMWASELGQNTRDELNRIRRGRNYGWPSVEGGDGDGPFADPYATWATSECSPSGIATAKGRVWVAALRGRALWSVRIKGSDAGRTRRWFHEDFGRIRTVERAPDGSLWIATSNRDGRGTPTSADDRVVRITL